MKKLTTSATPAAPTAAQGNPEFSPSRLRSCRFQFQDPNTFEVTAVYITHTDKTKFRVKIFRGGKCLSAKYVTAESFADLIDNL